MWSASQLLFLWQTGSTYPILEVCEFQFWQCRDCSCHVFLRTLAILRLHLIDQSSIEHNSACCTYNFVVNKRHNTCISPILWRVLISLHSEWSDLASKSQCLTTCALPPRPTVCGVMTCVVFYARLRALPDNVLINTVLRAAVHYRRTVGRYVFCRRASLGLERQLD